MAGKSDGEEERQVGERQEEGAHHQRVALLRILYQVAHHGLVPAVAHKHGSHLADGKAVGVDAIDRCSEVVGKLHLRGHHAQASHEIEEGQSHDVMQHVLMRRELVEWLLVF